MADKWNSDRDDPVMGGSDEEIRGVAEDDEFEDAEVLDEDEDEDEEEGSTF